MYLPDLVSAPGPRQWASTVHTLASVCQTGHWALGGMGWDRVKPESESLCLAFPQQTPGALLDS